MRSSNGDADVALRDGYEVSEEGANITITVDRNEDEQQLIETGQLERDGVVYEGGLIVDDETGQVISSPPFELRDESSHMQFPALESESGQFGGALEQSSVSSIESPAERLEIKIESEYYEQWADQFDNADNVDVSDSDERVTILYDFRPSKSTSYAMGLGSDEGAAVELNDIPETTIYSYENDPEEQRAFATFAANISDRQNQGGDLEIHGWYKYDEDGEEPQAINGEANVNITDEDGDDRDPEKASIGEQTPTADFLLDPEADHQEYNGGDQDLEGGVYATNGSVTINSTTATDESILIVQDNLTVDELGYLTAEDNLDVHVHGDLIIEDGASLGADDFDGTKTTVFADGDVELGNGANEEEPAEFTGLLYGTSSTVEVENTAKINGGVIAQQLTSASKQASASSHADELTVNFHEKLETQRSPYAVDGDGFDTPEQMNENRPEIHEFDIRISEIDAD